MTRLTAGMGAIACLCPARPAEPWQASLREARSGAVGREASRQARRALASPGTRSQRSSRIGRLDMAGTRGDGPARFRMAGQASRGPGATASSDTDAPGAHWQVMAGADREGRQARASHGMAGFDSAPKSSYRKARLFKDRFGRRDVSWRGFLRQGMSRIRKAW